MKKIVSQLKAGGVKEVLVLGDIMLDEYIFGTVDRISPEAPVAVVKESYKEWCLGGAANVAATCKHAGFNVKMVGIVGADVAGQKVIDLFKNHGIAADDLLVSPERVTTCKRRVMAKSHQLLRIDSEEDKQLSEQEFFEISGRIDRLLKKGMIILVSDYAKGVVSSKLLTYILDRAKIVGCVVLADPKGPNFEKYRGVNYLKPNLKEFAQMVQFFGLPHDRSLLENGQEVCKLLQLDGLIVTMGEKGINFITPDQNFISPACKREVYDLTGAGDTAFAFLALGVAHGLAMEQSLKLANHAAAIAVSHVKTYTVSLDELIDPNLEPNEKVFHDWAELKIELDWLRADGKKVVITNGCFDIMHSGHAHTLKESKKLGDILVVALNTDASIKRLKGPSRPINNLDERLAMMASIGVVDFVVPFDQDTPQALLEYLRPDVLVKGGDYKAEHVVGYELLKSYGGVVHIIDYVPGLSTTNIIQAIHKNKEHV